MTIGQRAEVIVRVVDVALVIVAALCIGWLFIACTPVQQASAPQFAPGPFAIAGQLEFADGTVVDLSAGAILAGGEGMEVRRVDLDVTGSLLVNGTPQAVTFVSRNHRLGDWVRCLLMSADVMDWRAGVRFPLSEQCGPSGVVELSYRPFPVAD